MVLVMDLELEQVLDHWLVMILDYHLEQVMDHMSVEE